MRVDVDFSIGMLKGVPFLLKLFKENNIKATFFIVMGPDTFLKHFRRLPDANYIKRLFRMNPLQIVSKMGLILLPKKSLKKMVGTEYPEIINQILNEGHEIGIHGYNHFFWAEKIWQLSKEEIKEQIKLALQQFKLLGINKPLVWGAPNWRCCEEMFEVLIENNFQYSSDTRGCFPFYPTYKNKTYKLPQLPITAPCFHELKEYGINKIINTMLKCLTNNFNLLCIHDYYEGILQQKLFQKFLYTALTNCYTFYPLREVFKNLNFNTLPSTQISSIKVLGGFKKVSCQQEFKRQNYFAIMEKERQLNYQ